MSYDVPCLVSTSACLVAYMGSEIRLCAAPQLPPSPTPPRTVALPLPPVEGGCHCTYCGAAVAVTQAARVAQARAQGDADTQGGTGAVDAGSDAVAAAEAFKDRLVDFDRNAQQRTTVIDDQSDFFEVTVCVCVCVGACACAYLLPVLSSGPSLVSVCVRVCVGCI
jgi:hypothetical protein